VKLVLANYKQAELMHASLLGKIAHLELTEKVRKNFPHISENVHFLTMFSVFMFE